MVIKIGGVVVWRVDWAGDFLRRGMRILPEVIIYLLS